MTYKQFESKWLGRRVDIDKVFDYQCVDLVKQYMLEVYGMPNGAYGNAIDYWTKPVRQVLEKFYKVQTTHARQGDVVILYGTSGNVYGHIGIATGAANATHIEILEQNGATGNGSGVGGDAIRKRYIPRTRVPGILRPKVTERKEEMITRLGLDVIYRFRRGAEPNAHALKSHLGKRTFDETDKLVRNATYATTVRNNAKAGKLNAADHLPADIRAVYVDPSKKKIAELEAEIARLKANPTVTEAGFWAYIRSKLGK